ncbi:MAG TPA: 4a-hydroxytetrahydrobiopterin dehydratase [Gemmata sp.]|jgi:4a-hydroxytetrahydrobiopterin dehydratase|nr:4a-hydroxytetrahydrobiopterin dehydratase [Gemmata sp.]
MSASNLANRRCVPCSSKTLSLDREAIQQLIPQIPGWRLSEDGKRLIRNWRVLDFITGLDFFRRIGDVAETEDHHPDLHLANYRDVTVELWTHAAGGLTENDFIMAAKIIALEQPLLKG